MNRRVILSASVVLIFVWGVCRAQQSREGMLTIHTIPEGIEVWLNDKYIGDSPIREKKLSPGPYTLKLVDPVQHTSIVEDIYIQPQQTTLVEKNITAKFGALQVASEPHGAEVVLYTKLGTTPLTNEFMNPGKYRIEVKHPSASFKPEYRDVTIPRGERVTISAKLERESPFDRKALLRLGFGAGAVLGYTWAIVENGNRSRYLERDTCFPLSADDELSAARKHRNRMVLGIVLGSLSVVGFEIVAFF